MITAQLVKDLREKTGAGMMECKKALIEANGDFDGAIEYLRKMGLKASAKKQSRVAADGFVVTGLSRNGRMAAMVEINCETDFVAKNDELNQLAQRLIASILEQGPSVDDEVCKMVIDNNETLDEKINLLTAKIGEKISYRRFVCLQIQPNQLISSYIHLGSKIGVLVGLEGTKASEQIARDIAMHVAASHPQYLESTDIPQDILDKEKAIYLEQLKDTGKPEPILEKIAEGKIAKFIKEVCLYDQVFIKDPSGKQSVRQMLSTLDPSLKIVSFVRFQVGEGMEKKVDDFAAEVAKMAGQ